MEGQPALLILILAVVAVIQIEGHRPVVPRGPTYLPSTYLPDEPLNLSRCSGIELELGCAMNEMLGGATSSPSLR